MTSHPNRKTILDPILAIQISKVGLSPQGTAQASSPITSLCFFAPSSPSERSDAASKSHVKAANILDGEIEANNCTNSEDDEVITNGEYDSINDENGEIFRCSQITSGHENFPTSNRFDDYANVRSYVLATASLNGETCIWDLAKSKPIGNFIEANRGPGMSLRRVDDSNDISQRILYQTRDAFGTVSLHDIYGKTCGIVETKSQSFCLAAPCIENKNLVALPDCDEKQAVVRDWRISQNSSECIRVGASDRSHESGVASVGDGMLTSLGLTELSSNSLVLVCGMESGNLFFHDLRMSNQSIGVFDSSNIQKNYTSSCNIGKDPVLSLDIANSQGQLSFVVVAGMAGDTTEIAEKDPNDRGTVALVKAVRKDFSTHNSTIDLIPNEGWLEARVRAKFLTCKIATNSNFVTPTGKPGVSTCRIHPTGRVFAVGGWDNRVRIFDRSVTNLSSIQGGLKAILRGHQSSVNAIDWCPSTCSPGLLATAGSSDDKIFIWEYHY